MPRATRTSRNSRRPQRSLPKAVFIALFGLVGLFACFLVVKLELVNPDLGRFFPIRKVRVQGELANLNPELFQQTLSPLVGGGFFSVDIGAIERVVESSAWVDSARVYRQWPDTLVIEVSEQMPVARWGADSLLSNQGIVFKKPSDLSDLSGLPLLAAPKGREKQAYEMMVALNEALSARHLNITSLELSNRLAWTAKLSDGLVIAYGKQDPVLATARAFGLLAQLGKERSGSIRKLDLRYQSGFSLVLKSDVDASPEVQGMTDNKL